MKKTSKIILLAMGLVMCAGLFLMVGCTGDKKTEEPEIAGCMTKDGYSPEGLQEEMEQGRSDEESEIAGCMTKDGYSPEGLQEEMERGRSDEEPEFGQCIEADQVDASKYDPDEGNNIPHSGKVTVTELPTLGSDD